MFDPSKGVDEMIDFYLKKGYTLELKLLLIVKLSLKYGMTMVFKMQMNMNPY